MGMPVDPFCKMARATGQADVGGGGGADRISGLSDDLLHTILLRLDSTPEAARTGILCRRWRRVWAYLPELSFRYQNEPVSVAQAHGRVDAALAAHSAASISRLEITIPDGDGSPGIISADRVSPWLLFASERLAGELSLSLPYNSAAHEEEELLLPPCERVTAIRFDLNRTLRFGSGGGGAFSALVTLEITHAGVDGRELERFVSTCCPRLEELVLEWITLRDGGARALSIRSGSLRRLVTWTMGFDEGRLEVVAPELRSLCPESHRSLHVAAPNLSELIWHFHDYDPARHQFVEAGRHRLVTSTNRPEAALMRRFDGVDELNVRVSIAKGTQDYERYLEDIKNLSTKCQVLVVTFTDIEHPLMPTVLHLLTKCVGIRKLVVDLTCTEDYPCKSSGYPCAWQGKPNKVALDTLQEIEVKGHDSDYKVELMRLLCRRSYMVQKKVPITVHTQSGYMRAKINKSIRARNNQVRLTVRCS